MNFASGVSEEKAIDKIFKLSFITWVSTTIFFIISNSILILIKGYDSVGKLIQNGPFSITWLTLTSVGIFWIGFGVSLALLKNHLIRQKYGLTVILSFLVLAFYLNIFRERINYGDVGDYIRASRNLVNSMPFHSRYLYPPFLATLLTPILPLGRVAVEGILWAANILSLCAFFILLVLVLQKYGYNKNASHWIGFFFVLVNVPILRTLGYYQINIHVTNLIFFCLLTYKNNRILSAFFLCLAVHLKFSPIVLVLPFLLNRDFRWMAWFFVFTLLIAGITVVPFGWNPFFSFLNNIQNVYIANDINFRETSVDSLFRSLALFIDIPSNVVSLLIMVTKAGILLFSLGVMAQVVKSRTFMSNNTSEDLVFNSFPILLIFMLLASPLVWEHHPVFVALPYLLVMKRLNSPALVVLFVFSFILEYYLPTFDFFPWSFGRLLSPLLLLIIVAKLAKTNSLSYWDKICFSETSMSICEKSE